MTGPMQPTTASGNRYAKMLVDKVSGLVLVHTSKTKGDASSELRTIIKAPQLETGRTVRRYHNDGAPELLQVALGNSRLKALGTQITLTLP